MSHYHSASVRSLRNCLVNTREPRMRSIANSSRELDDMVQNSSILRAPRRTILLCKNGLLRAARRHDSMARIARHGPPPTGLLFAIYRSDCSVGTEVRFGAREKEKRMTPQPGTSQRNWLIRTTFVALGDAGVRQCFASERSRRRVGRAGAFAQESAGGRLVLFRQLAVHGAVARVPREQSATPS